MVYPEYTPQAELSAERLEQFERLRTELDLNDEAASSTPNFAMIFSDDSAWVSELTTRLARYAETELGVRPIMLRPTNSLDMDESIQNIVSAGKQGHHPVIWDGSLVPYDEATDSSQAWQAIVRGLNRKRDVIRSAVRGTVILQAPLATFSMFREAEDLFSMVTTSIYDQ